MTRNRRRKPICRMPPEAPFVVESRFTGRTRWERHIPGYWSRDAAERDLEERRFHGLAAPGREYRVVDRRDPGKPQPGPKSGRLMTC